MDPALYCAQCGTPARGTRFCTSCGSPTRDSAGVDAPAPVPWAPWPPPQAHDAQVTGTLPATTAVLDARPVPYDEPTPPWVSGQPAPHTPRTRPNVLAVVVVSALALSGWAIVRGVEQHTLSGTVLLTDSTYLGLEPGASCTGRGGYGDLGGGTQVVLTDDRSETLSTGRLTPGRFDGLGCVFSFALEDVTRSDFYGLTVGSGSRGQLQYSYEELADGDWSVQLSIGDDT